MPGSDEVNKNLKEFRSRLLAGIYAISQNRASWMEADAKRKAPWTDRTGNARSGLFGEATIVGDVIRVRIAHSVEYGPYLELCNSKKYSILEDTAKAHAPEYFSDIERLVRG